MISISVADGAGLQNYDAVLEHIFNTHRTTNTVKESWLNAMRKREAEYPTGIELEGYSIAYHTVIVNMQISRLFISSVCQTQYL